MRNAENHGLFYKFTRPGRVPSFQGGPGAPYRKWLPWVEDPMECMSGYHVCSPGHLVSWVDEELWVVEARGDCDSGLGKRAFSQIRFVRKVKGWNWRKAQGFAVWCIERHLEKFKEDRLKLSEQCLEALEARKHCAAGRWGKHRFTNCLSIIYHPSSWYVESACLRGGPRGVAHACREAAFDSTCTALDPGPDRWDISMGAERAAKKEQEAELHRLLGIELGARP